MLLNYKKWLFDIWRLAAILSIITISLVSLNHIKEFTTWLNISVSYMGMLWFLGLVLTITYIGRNYFKELLLVSLFFLLFGYILGAYLEPPSDPLEHLRRAYAFCDLSPLDIPKSNYGFWHYALSSLFLCNDYFTKVPKVTLNTIDLLYGIYQALLLGSLFVVGKESGLSSRWSFFSVLLAFLFLGTNKFSFFGYYSLAATASSLLIYWLWIAAFFFKRKNITVFYGATFALLCFPILWVNHKQEAAFLGLIFLVWCFIILHVWVWGRISCISGSKRYITNGFYILLFIIVLVLLPASDDIYIWMSNTDNNLLEDIAYYWSKNKFLYFNWGSYYPVGDFIHYRVADSLALMGFMPVFLVPILLMSSIGKSIDWFRILILSVFPLIVLFVPLLSSIWIFSLLPSTSEAIYWRLVYSSLYWLAISAVFYKYEDIIVNHILNITSEIELSWKFKKLKSKVYVRNILFSLCVFVIILLAGISRSPVYGKLDFLTVNSRDWWERWESMLEQVSRENRPIYTDYTTSVVLYDIFNIPTANALLKGEKYRQMSFHSGEMDIKEMNSQSTYQCVINLKGFDASWVPKETMHWDHLVALTQLQYRYDGIKIEDLRDILPLKKLDNCVIYK